MTQTDRRGFLQGVFGGVTAAGVIVMAPERVAAHFTPEIGAPVTLVEPTYSRYVMPGDSLYNAQGQVVAVVRDVSRSRNAIEVTTFNSSTDEYILGILNIDIHAKGVPFDQYGQVMTCSYCGSPRPFLRSCASCGAGK